MKKGSLCVVLLLAFTAGLFAQVNYNANTQVTPYTGRFRAGVNLGYYPLWGNQQMAAIAAGDPAQNQIGVGSRSVRQGLPDLVLGIPIYGYNFLRNDFNYYNSLNMSNGEAVGIVGDPLEWHRDQTNYCPSQPNKKSKFFANMYTPIWDGGANGTPYNDNNYWAAYLYEVVNAYKDDVRFWEIWNEPGLDFGACGWRPPGDPTCNWWDRDPSPCELELGAPIEHYVRALRIAYDVIKTVDPDSYVCLGSMGYAAGLDAVLRNTDNPNGGGVTPEYPLYGGAYFDCVTMHTYPHFDGSTLNFDGGIFQRHSDRAADGVFLFRDTYQAILNNYGYNGTTYPRKEYIITEANIPRNSYPPGRYIAGVQAQINFIQKAWIVSKLERIGSYHVYQLFDRKLPQNANYEFDEMGLYKTVEPNGTNTIGPFGQQVNDEGKAFKTVSDMLFNTDYDAVETAKMGLSNTSAARGYAFKRPDGKFVYVLWARTTTDLSENASATYSFPASMNVGTLTRHNWDWSYTQVTSQVGSTNIQLDATPVYFVGGQAPTTCSITASVSNVVCNNNGTPNNPADDTYTFNLTVNSAGPCAASGWTATAGVTGTGTYGVAKSFGPFPISGGNKVITVRDNNTSTATATVTAFAPPTCSGGSSTCAITAAISNVLCNNNGTPTNPADDTYTFTLTVNQNGNCAAAGWTASGSITSSGAYGTPKQFGPFPISSGGRSFTVSDATSTNVTTAVSVSAPATCSTAPAACNNNLLGNPDFSSGLNGWNFETGVTAVGGGVGNSGAVSHCTNGQRFWQTVSSTTAGIYVFQAQVRTNGTAATGTLALKFLNSSWTPLLQEFAPIPATSTFQNYSVQGVAPTGTAYVEVSVLKETGSGCLIVDDACLGTSGGGGTTPTVTINCPQNITVTAASGASSATVTYATPTATATNCSSSPTVTRTQGPASGSAFPIGTTTIVHTATCGTATTSCTFTVTVNNPTAPTVTFTTCPQNIVTTAASGATGAVVTYATPTASATNCSTTPVVTRTAGPASGSTFPLGTTTVTHTATCGTASAVCTFTVTVNPTSGAGCTTSLLANSGFEQGLTNWNVGSGITQVAGGANGSANAASLCTNGQRMYQTITGSAGQTYSVELQAKNNGTPASGVIAIKFLNSSWAPLISDFGPINSVTSSYKLFTASEPAPAGTAYVEISVLKETGAGCLIVDNVCLSTGGGGGGTTCQIALSASDIACNNNGTPNNPADDTWTFNLNTTPTGNCGTTYSASGGVTGTGTLGTPRSFGPLPISGGPINVTVTSTQTNTSATLSVAPPAPCSGGSGGSIDLSLNITATPQSPGIWANTTVTVTITNAGPAAATGVSVKTPAQNSSAFSNVLAYTGHTAATGTNYDAWLGNWTIGNLGAGQSRTLTYQAFTKTASSIPFFVQVSAANETDSDSQPNNNTTGIPAQDDEALVNINGSQALQSGRPYEPAELPDLDAFTLYPNPAGEKVNLALDAYLGKSVQIKVLNQIGKITLEEQIDVLRTPVIEIPLTDVQNGMYFVQVNIPGLRPIIRKLIVTRQY